MSSVVHECSGLLGQSLGILTSLQEDPTIQRVETKVCKLQQAYDTARSTTQMVTITKRLTKMKKAQALKAEVDTVRQ